jgi:fructokinase
MSGGGMSGGGMSGPRVCVIGEALIDLVPGTGAGQFVAHPGGSPYNVAIGLARLGQPTALFARLADNAFGRLLRARAVSEGIELDFAPAATEPTTLAVVSLDDQARAQYDFYLEGTADWQWTAAELAHLPDAGEVVHFGSLAAWTPPGNGPILAAVSALRAAEQVLVSYDPNVRPSLLRSPLTARPSIEAGVAVAHLVKASREDVEWLYPDDSLPDVARGWLELGAVVVVITDGGDGAHGYTASGSWTVAARPVSVVDTVGAGDAFTSGLLAGLVRREVSTPTALRRARPEVLAAAVDEAILVSALTCERAGADPPTLAEFRARQ